MSQYLYQQYPQYPQPPAGAGSGIIPPPQEEPVPPGDKYVPIDSNATWAEMHSQALTNLAAGNDAPQFAVLIPPAPSGSAQYPFLMYAKDGTTKGAKDAQDKASLTSQGYSDNPPPPDPYALTAQMLQDLQLVWSKAGDTLTQLMQLVQQQQKQMQAAGAILQQQQGPPPQWTGQQQQYPGQQPQYPTSGYPQPTGD